MECKEAIGRRRSIRYIDPDRPVEREKIQKMLEAARLASHWGNVQTLGAVVVERATAPQHVLDAIPTGSAIGGFQLRIAPVLIFWYCDVRMMGQQGTRLHELVDAGALGVDVEQSHRFLDETLIPFFEGANEAIKSGGANELDCGQGIAQATLVAFDEGLGATLIGLAAQVKLRKALGLPKDCKLLGVQTVGYPLESWEAGGQRPRLPFEQRFFLNQADTPFPRSEAVVDELTAAKMFTRPGPLPGRREELKRIADQLGLKPIFGDEAPAMMQAIMEDIQAQAEEQ